jgi:anti-anti-sigma factor
MVSDGTALLTAGGQLDLTCGDRFIACLREARDAEPERLVVDLREVTFIDSSGLGVIVGQQKRSQERNERFAVAVGGSLAVQRILDLSGLVKVLDIVDDPSERLAA